MENKELKKEIEEKVFQLLRSRKDIYDASGYDNKDIEAVVGSVIEQTKARIKKDIEKRRNIVNHLEITYNKNRTFVHKVAVLNQFNKLIKSLEEKDKSFIQKLDECLTPETRKRIGKRMDEVLKEEHKKLKEKKQ